MWTRLLAFEFCVASLALIAACGPASRPAATQTPGSATPRAAASPGPFPSITPKIQGSTKPDSITAIAAYGDNVWIAVDDTIVASADGGSHWRQLATIGAGVASLSFTSALDGWAATPSGLLHTSDGGGAWHTDAGLRQAAVRVRFADERHGWVVTKQDQLLRTSDAGASWTPISNPCSPGPGNEFASLALPSFINDYEGWTLCPGQPSAGSQGKDLFHTEDGGAGWTLFSFTAFDLTPSPLPLPVAGYATDLFFLDAEHGWMSEERRGIVATDDGARSWRWLDSFQRVSPEPTAESVIFVSPTRGYALAWGNGAPIVTVTRDGGASWDIVYALPSTAWTMPTPDPNASFALGGRRSTWTSLLPSYRVSSGVVEGNQAWVVASPCSEQTIPPAKATAIGRPSSWLSCYPTMLLHTSDAGRTWTQYNLSGLDPEGVRERGGHVELVAAGEVFEITDGGSTFVRVRPPLVPDR